MSVDVTEANRLRVQEIYGEYVSGNLPFLMEALAEDICWTSGDDAVAAPWCGQRIGRDAVREYFAALAAECEIVDYRVGQIIADGDWVAVTATVRARYHRSGQEREVAKVDVLRLQDGQVREFREYYDTAQIARDLCRADGPA